MVVGKLDLVVGMQYGDEGKGVSAVMLHTRKKYKYAVRVGGSQAEHRYKHNGKTYRFRVLPSVAGIDSNIDLYLAAGMVIRRDILRSEIENYNINPDRVFIDGSAAVVEADQVIDSKLRASYGRGGYSMGISGTLIRKIRRDPSDIPLASEYNWDGIGTVVDVSQMVAGEVIDGNAGIVEGSQGALLSLDHGFYPYVTSYNTTAPAVMSSLGLGYDFVREIYGVLRTFPIRVAGDNSGVMLGERVTFDEIEKGSGVKIPLERRYQADEDGSSMGTENVAKFSMSELSRAMLLNTPTKLILTHTDWLTERCKTELIKKIETKICRMFGKIVPVAYVRYGEEIEDYDYRH